MYVPSISNTPESALGRAVLAEAEAAALSTSNNSLRKMFNRCLLTMLTTVLSFKENSATGGLLPAAARSGRGCWFEPPPPWVVEACVPAPSEGPLPPPDCLGGMLA